jgi:hypothetical protein
MLVTFPAKASSSVGFLARRTDRMLYIKRFPDAKGLPLEHANCHGLVNKLAVFNAGVVECDANKGGSPGRGSVGVSHATHVSSFVIFLTALAHSQAAVRKFDIKSLMKTRRRESENIAMRNGLRIHHLLNKREEREDIL